MNEADRIIEAAAKFAKNGGQPQEQVNIVQPQPAPMSLQLMQRPAPDGKTYVVLLINHLYGQSAYHFDADAIDAIADAMKDAARLARTGLEIPKFTS